MQRGSKGSRLQFAKDACFLGGGIFCATFGLESSLLPNQFIDGGATGISLLLAEAYTWPLYVLVLLVNVPFVLLGFKVIGKQFAIKTTLAIMGLALVLATGTFPEVRYHHLREERCLTKHDH